MADAPSINTPLPILEALNDALIDDGQRLARSIAVVIAHEHRTTVTGRNSPSPGS